MPYKALKGLIRDNKTLFSLILKQLLAVSQASRDAQQVVHDVWLAPADTALIKVPVGQNLLYDKKVRKKGKGHGLGPPWLITTLGLFVGIMQMLEEQEQKQKKEEVEQLILTWKGMSMEEQSDLVRFCRIVKTFETNTKKLVLSFGAGKKAQEIRSTLTGIITQQEGAQYKLGRPPAGYMERELGIWLKELLS